jgi:acyl-CoA thioesterase I
MLLATLLACTIDINRGDLDDAEMIAIGDSLFEWNMGDGSIPEVIGESLDRSMYNASVSGSHFLDGGDDAIPDQYISGDWSWLVLDGGGNDFNDRCACGDCDEIMDEMLSSDGQEGVMADFVREVSDAGVRVLIMGYYGLPETAEFGFDQCLSLIPELSARQEALAASDEMIEFADATEVVDGVDLSMFDDDHVHPSIEGSAVVGAFLADAIRAAEAR